MISTHACYLYRPLILFPMKFPIPILLSIFFANSLKAQDNKVAVDSALAAKITVSGFCLCQTTVADLKHLDKNLAEVAVEEMDLGKRCIASDGRFVNGRGYYSDSFPGMIFQKDQSRTIAFYVRVDTAKSQCTPWMRPITRSQFGTLKRCEHSKKAEVLTRRLTVA